MAPIAPEVISIANYLGLGAGVRTGPIRLIDPGRPGQWSVATRYGPAPRLGRNWRQQAQSAARRAGFRPQLGQIPAPPDFDNFTLPAMPSLVNMPLC